MNRRKREEEGRSIEAEMEIDAPADAVWKALTDAAEISRWFSPRAEVAPAVDGSICWTWDDEIKWESRIEIWEPNRHLRALYEKQPQGADPSTEAVPIAMDFFLDAREGKTILRLVHSGFGRGADWDDEYDGTRRGWHYELRAMRHYLEHHRGRDRSLIWIRASFAGSDKEAWRHMMSLGGLSAESQPGQLSEGARYETTSATGDRLSGELLLYADSKELCATVDELNNGLLRFALESCAGQKEIWIWFATYGVAESELKSMRERWEASIAKVFR